MEKDTTAVIGRKIKSIRLANGISLQRLSEQTNLSKGLLSKIENARTIPSLPVFISLAQALRVSPGELFEDVGAEKKPYLHIRRSEYEKFTKEDRRGFDYEFILSQVSLSGTFQVCLLTVKPKAEARRTTTDGFEFKYMVHGRCEYHIGEDVVELNEGDSLYFDARTPHAPVNKSKGNAVMLVVYFLQPEKDRIVA